MTAIHSLSLSLSLSLSKFTESGLFQHARSILASSGKLLAADEFMA